MLLDGVNRRDNIRNSVKFANVNKYKNYVKLLWSVLILPVFIIFIKSAILMMISKCKIIDI